MRSLEKSQNFKGKTNSTVLILQWKDAILYFLTTLRTNSFRRKDLKKTLHLILFEGESKHTVVSSHGTAYPWDKILHLSTQNPESTRYSQEWTWEDRSMNLQSGSDQRTSGIESYVRFRRLWRSISQRRMPRETEKHKQKIFHTKHCWFQMQRRQWRRNERRSWRRHFKKSKGKSTLLALTDIRHIQQCKYIPVNVRKSNLKCGKLSSPDAQAVHELPDKIYQDKNDGRKFKWWQSSTKWLTVVTNEKLQEWIQNHLAAQVPSLSISECPIWILTKRGTWIVVHHCAKRKKTSIICVANLPSPPWKITSMVHKIRTTLKRRWIFKPASGNRCLHDAGKTRPHRRAAAAAAAAAILCLYIPRQSPLS